MSESMSNFSAAEKLTVFVRRKRYSVAGWKWLERAAIGHKNLMELAELTHILLKEG
jgi:hypothetical protein